MDIEIQKEISRLMKLGQKQKVLWLRNIKAVAEAFAKVEKVKMDETHVLKAFKKDMKKIVQSEEQGMDVKKEKEFIASFILIPTLISKEDTLTLVENAVLQLGDNANIGSVIKQVKQDNDVNLLDMSVVARLVKQCLN